MDIPSKKPWWMISPRIGREHFFIMLVLAIAIHLSGLIWWYKWFSFDPVEIPVRVMNLRLGSGGEIFAKKETEETAPPLKRTQAMRSPQAASSMTPSVPMPAQKAQAPAQMMKEEPEVTATIAAADEVAGEVQAQQPETVEVPPLDTSPAESAMAEDQPHDQHQQSAEPVAYTRTAGSRLGLSEREKAQIIAKYEQQLSAWIQRHKRYPIYAQKRGITGRGIVRIRINRQGHVLFSKLEMRTGNKLLDQAALDMIRRADPVPPIPNAYGSGQHFEFQIPVIFK